MLAQSETLNSRSPVQKLGTNFRPISVGGGEGEKDLLHLLLSTLASGDDGDGDDSIRTRYLGASSEVQINKLRTVLNDYLQTMVVECTAIGQIQKL